MKEKEGFVPILEYILANQDFHKMMVTLPPGEFPQRKWQLTGGNSFTLRQEKIDYMMDKDYFKKIEGREAQPKFDLYSGLQTERDRKDYMESHPLSVENLIDEDFRR